MALRRKTPADRLFYAILGLSLALIAVIYCAVNQPSSHLRFEVKERQKISVFDAAIDITECGFSCDFISRWA